MIKRNIGKYIRKYRKERGLTQEQLALAIGTSRPNIGSWESDRTEPSINDVEKIADYFGIRITDIIGDTQPDLLFDTDLKDFVSFIANVAPNENRKAFFDSLKKIALALAN